MKKMLKIVCNEWVNASRDKRDLSAAREAGFDVAVMAKGGRGDKMREENVDGFRVYRCSTRPVKWFPNSLNRIVSALQWVIYARRYGADVLNCHDLGALGIGWLSSLFMGKDRRPKLIYDSHEFELGRCTSKKRGKIKLWCIAKAEKFLMKRCVFSMIPGDWAADEVQRIHGLAKRPIVVRNIPGKWNIDPAVCAEKRKEILTKLSVCTM